MKRSLQSRIQKLEAELLPLMEPTRPFYGLLSDVRQLPEDYDGPRHVVVVDVRRDANGRESWKYEERPGPEPPGPPDPRLPCMFLSEIDLRIAGDPIDELESSELERDAELAKSDTKAGL